MRTLCINLQTTQEPACAEIFLSLSPRVQYRDPGFIFIDIESTLGLLGGEDRALNQALALAQLLGPKGFSNTDLHPTSAIADQPTAAIADNPAIAQVLSILKPGFISEAGLDFQSLKPLPVSALQFLEGLRPWGQIRQVEHIIAFFQTVGIHFLEQILFFELPTFRERWGETGVTLWRRLHGREEQAISPLSANLPLVQYVHLDDPVSMLQLFMPVLSQALSNLFLRTHGRGRFVKTLNLHLYCEYSEKKHFFQIEPVSPSRDQDLFEDLIERKLSEVDLENPIREFEIELHDVPEKTQQLDFFEPRDQTEDRWKRLISFARQAEIEVGFLEVQPKHFPEQSYQLKSDWPKTLAAIDKVELIENAIQVKSVYAKGLLKAPRPTLLLKNPQPLTQYEFSRYRKLSFFPIERIDATWWQKLKPKSRKETETAGPSVIDWAKYRDYYFALSQEGQLVWVFQDRETKNFFLHGYFD